MINFLVEWVCLPLLVVLVIALVVSEHGKSENKELLYNECLTTDYDKFQCYSMIYGDK